MKPGDHIKVKVGGVEYDTVVDPQGVQRFIADPVIRTLVNAEVIDLNEVARLYVGDNKDPGFTQREYAEFNMKLGYSLGGFAELSWFFDMEIENPIEEKKE